MRYFIFILTCFLSTVAAAAAPSYGVLVYHNIVDESSLLPTPAVAVVDKKYYPQTMTVTTLVKQFNWLKDNGYKPVHLQQIIDAKNGGAALPDKAVLLSFDDGYESFYRLVYPLLKIYNYPATQALVTSWIDAADTDKITFGTQMLPRSEFLTWPQIKEMQTSGLVEFASHTDNSHKSVFSNPAQTQQAAILSLSYLNNRYETEAEYRKRVGDDFKQSAQKITTHTGVPPRIMVWPYGQFNDVDVQLARDAGFEYFFTLGDSNLNTLDTNEVGRLLLDEEASMSGIEEYLTQSGWRDKTQRVVHVDMDYIYDANPTQLNKNLDALIERIYRYGISTVYLQAYSDADGNGVADALYFPNRHLPMKADLMNRIAWQLSRRGGVQVYAWMPMLAFNLGAGYDYVTDVRTGKPASDAYLRLSPYSAKNRAVIQEIYQDLGIHAKFDGILFHDDGFLTDFEGPIAQGTRTLEQMRSEAQAKTQYLIDFSQTLKNAAGQYQRGGVAHFKTARNIYASVITDNQAQQWFAQNLKTFTQAYDYTAVMAMPYMEHEQSINAAQANEWLANLASTVKQQVPLDKVVFELQAVNWRTKKPIANSEIMQWMNTLKTQGVQNFGYYPDNFIENQPDAQLMHPVFSISTQGILK